MPLRFSAWFPLSPDVIDANAPATGGLFEVRVYGTLLVYPKGRSAMVLYGSTHAEARHLDGVLRELLDRGLPEAARQAIGSHPVYYRTAPSAKPAEDLRQRLADFELRFGSYPVGNR